MANRNLHLNPSHTKVCCKSRSTVYDTPHCFTTNPKEKYHGKGKEGGKESCKEDSRQVQDEVLLLL